VDTTPKKRPIALAEPEPFWGYDRRTGILTNPSGDIFSTAYSGHGAGLNNPVMSGVENVGPLPAGVYTIGQPQRPQTHLGPIAMPLEPDASNAMFGRSGFFIHGDNAAMNHTASDGCIIVKPVARAIMERSNVRRLVVT
jgi:hypothetical protein